MRLWLRQKRKARYLSQQQVATRIFVTQQHYSKIEQGCECSVDTAKRIASLFEFNWQELFE